MNVDIPLIAAPLVATPMRSGALDDPLIIFVLIRLGFKPGAPRENREIETVHYRET